MNDLEFLIGDAATDRVIKSAISRRDFFRIGAAATGGLLLSIHLPLSSDARGVDGPFEPNVFIRIDPDDTVTFTSPRSEMGQGTRTALAMILVEELDGDWSRVTVEQANFHEKYGGQTTGGSASIRTRWDPLREAGATARAMLVAAAATTWSVDPGSCDTEPGVVVHRSSGRRVTYGEVAAAAARLPIPSEVVLKDPSTFRIVGKPKMGVNVLDIVQGKGKYGIDVRVPGMLFAVIERCPVFGGKVARFDATRALAVPGVRHVVEVVGTGRPIHVASGVAVVAENTWAAMMGRRALEIEWDFGEGVSESSAALYERMRELTSKPCGEVMSKGDADAVLASAEDTVAAVYEMPFLAHSPLEPMNTTAHVQGDRCELWIPTQNPSASHGGVASTLGLPPENVQVNIVMSGGAFGRRLTADFAVEAALVSRAAGDVPVQVLWTREDDLQHSFYRPINLHRMEAVLGEDGFPTALRHRISSTSLRETSAGPGAENQAGGEVGGAADMPYRIPNRRCEYVPVSAHLPRGAWRSVSHTHTAFAVQSFIDEMAHAAGKDPLAYRLALIDEEIRPNPDQPFSFNPARLKGVLKLAAEKAGWGEPLPSGHGLGIAGHFSFSSYAAQVIEVSVGETGRVRVHRIVTAVDCGRVINPDSAQNQAQGAAIDGLSVAIHQEATLEGGRIIEENFNDYELLRINEAPRVIEVHFVESDAPPSGLGEPALPPVAPALANAIFAATGKRVRKLPLKNQDLRS